MLKLRICRPRLRNRAAVASPMSRPTALKPSTGGSGAWLNVPSSPPWNAVRPQPGFAVSACAASWHVVENGIAARRGEISG